MHDSFLKFFRELDRRVRVMLVGLGLYNWNQSLPMQYNQLYVSALGANPVELGSLSGIGAAVSSIISAPVGWAADKYGVKRVILLGLTLSTVVAGIYGWAHDWRLLIPAIVLGSVGMGLIWPFTDIIFIGYTKPELRSMVMGFSRVICGIPTIFAPVISAIIVARFGGINAPGIRPLYFIQLVLFIFVFIFVIAMLKTPPAMPSEEKDELGSKDASFIRDFRDVFKGEKWLKRWIVMMTIRWFGMSMAMPFTPLWLVYVKGADPYTLGMMGTAGTIVSVLLQVPVGRMADRIGRKKVFYLLQPFTYLGTLLLITAPSPEYLILVGLLGGAGFGFAAGIGGVSFVPFITMNWEMVPAEKRGRWYGVSGVFNIFNVLAGILGGIMWQQGRMIEVLLLPIILDVLIVIPILITVPDTLGRSKQ